MMVLQVIGEAVGLVVGSLAAATLFCWLCWNAFKVVRHPELGVPLCLAVVLAVCRNGLAGSPLLRLAWSYAALAAVVLWPLGLAWRHRHTAPPR
jgi:hypothetical protein